MGNKRNVITLKGGVLQFGGENSLLSCEDGLRVTPADHIGSAVAWGRMWRVRDRAGGEGGCAATDPVPSACPQHPIRRLLRPRAFSSSPRKARGSSPASSNAGCDTHRYYITVPSAPRRRLSEKEEGEEEGSFTGSRSAPQLQPLQRAQAWKQAEGWKAAPSARREDRLRPSPGTPTSQRFFLTRSTNRLGVKPRSSFSYLVPSPCAHSNNCLPTVPHPTPFPRPVLPLLK